MNCEGRICVPLIHHLYFSEVRNLIKLHPGRLFWPLWKRPCPLLLLHYLRFPHCVFSSIVLICLTSISPVMMHILVQKWPHHLITFWMPRTCSAMAHRRHLVSGSLLNKWRLSMMMEGNIEVQSTDSRAILLGFECQFFYVLAVWS